MELNKKQTEFWAVLLMVCLVVSVAIMLVDFQIKQAILEESARLKLIIETWEFKANGLRESKNRGTDNSADNSAFPAVVLVDPATGMEAGNVPDSTAKQANGRPGSNRRKSDRQAND